MLVKIPSVGEVWIFFGTKQCSPFHIFVLIVLLPLK